MNDEALKLLLPVATAIFAAQMAKYDGAWGGMDGHAERLRGFAIDQAILLTIELYKKEF
jgi:hypothetical protein